MNNDVQTFTMETRLCTGKKCGQEFRVNSDSKQIYHSSFCQSNDSESPRKMKEWEKWRVVQSSEPLSVSCEKENVGEQRNNECTQTPTMLNDTEANKGKSTQEIERQKKLETLEPTTLTEARLTNEEQNQEGKTAKEKTQLPEKDTTNEENISFRKLTNADAEMIQQLDSSAQLSLSALDVSESMNCLNSSAQQMLTLMKSAAKSSDLSSKQIAVRSAREVREAIKTKLEVSKFVYKTTVGTKATA